MVCELKIKELEKKMNRKLTSAEKKYVESMMHHSEIEIREEEMIPA